MSSISRCVFVASFVMLDTWVDSSLCLFEDGGLLKDLKSWWFPKCLTSFKPFFFGYLMGILCILSKYHERKKINKNLSFLRHATFLG